MADEPKAKNAIWITSGLAIVAACIAAIMEYGSATRLERQKFEYSLIEKALVSDEGLFLAEGETSRQEATRRLEFLINIGVIKVLDEDALRKAAENPAELPTFNEETAGASLTETTFSCKNDLDDNPVMGIVILSRSVGNVESRYISMIKFSTEIEGTTSIERCNTVAAQFQKAYDEDKLKFIRTGKANNQPVLCASNESGGECEIILLTLPSDESARTALTKLLTLNRASPSVPLLDL